MAFLDIVGTTKSFGATEVLHRVDIAVDQGDFLVLVGPSGCGKTTLLNMVAGLEQVSSGEIHLNGRQVNDVAPASRNIAMVFQSYALYPNMNVAQNITFGLEMHGVPKPERDRALAEVAELLQIEPYLKRKPSQLSGGQRQRVAMGRALVRKPDLFLFDEPLSNLDAKLRVTMRTEIKKLHQKLGVTMFYVTHDQIEAMTLATKIAVMDKGYVQQFGTPAQIYNQPANIFVASFMGSPPMNLIEAKIAKRAGEAHVVIAEGDGEAALALVDPDGRLAGMEGREVIVGLRPENITSVEEGPGGATSARLGLTLEVIEPSGSDTFVTFTLAGNECIARLRADAQVRPGERIECAIDMAKAVLFDPATTAKI